MFGYEAGGVPLLLAGMIAERDAARNKWPFLTTLDLSTLHNEPQLVAMVKDRTGKPRSEAQGEVHKWLEGYEKRLASAIADAALDAPIRRSGGWGVHVQDEQS